MTINNLPNEILIKILGYLPPPDLHNAYRVNNHWANMAKSLGVFQLDLALCGLPNVARHYPTVEEGARIRHILILSHHLLSKEIFEHLQLLCPNTSSFDYDQQLLSIIGKRRLSKRHCLLTCHWRQSITRLPACHKDVYKQEWSHDYAICQRLESLYIWHDSHLLSRNSDNYLHLDLPYLPHLTTLTLHVFVKCRETPINAICRCCFMLTSLTLRNMSLSCVHGRRNPEYGGYKLQILKLDNVAFSSHPTFSYFPLAFPNIKALQLSMPNNGTVCRRKGMHTNHLLYNMAIQFKRLTSLVFELHGFGTELNPVDTWLDDKMHAYFSRPSKQHVLVNITYD